MNKRTSRRAPADLPVVLDRFRKFLANNGMRFTAQRRLIAEQAFRQPGHFDAEQLYDVFHKAGRNVSRTTVYRTLAHLRDCGLIREMPQLRGPAYYEHLHEHEHHDHMVCVKCGRVIEFCDEGLEALQERICRRRGFRATDHRMSIRGTCRECRRAADGGQDAC